MSPGLLKELALQSTYPRGIAARVDSADLKLLLEERVELLVALETCVDSESVKLQSDIYTLAAVAISRANR